MKSRISYPVFLSALFGGALCAYLKSYCDVGTLLRYVLAILGCLVFGLIYMVVGNFLLSILAPKKMREDEE